MSSHMLKSISILTLITVSSYLATVFQSLNEFTKYDILGISLLLIGVIAIQCLAIYAMYCFTKNPSLLAIFVSICAVFNIFCVKLVFIEDFVQQEFYIRIILLLVGAFIIYTLLKISVEVKRGVLWAGLLVIAAFSVDLASVFVLATDRNVEKAAGKPAIRLVNFSKKPNVYIVSFDSLIPRSLIKAHLGLEKVAYTETLEENFTVFRNMFADKRGTQKSLNSFLAFDINYWEQLENPSSQGFLTGAVSSPLFEIFKHNGYETHFVNYGVADPNVRGKYIDHHHLQYKNLRACTHIDTSNILVFFGFCKIRKHKKARVVLDFVKDALSDTEQEKQLVYFMMDHWKEFLTSGKPQIFLTYIFSPGHTPPDYKHSEEEQRKKFVDRYARSSKRTVKFIQEILDFLRKYDNEGILFVFGDHGPALSRQYELAEEPVFFIQDRHGIFGGLYPNDVCQQQTHWLLNEAFATPTKVARELVRCLADGDDPFMVAPQYRVYGEPYEDFLYE